MSCPPNWPSAAASCVAGGHLGVARSQRRLSGARAGKAAAGAGPRDCYEAGKTFAFVAVILDCVNDAAKAFYQHWDFEAFRAILIGCSWSAKRLEAMMEGP